MNAFSDNSPESQLPGPRSSWTAYLGLSRTPHSVLDVATPAMAALLWLGHFPSIWVTIVGLITAFAGYTAVYALNDLIDYRVDRERLALQRDDEQLFHVDELFPPHPVASGVLTFRQGLLWFLFWAVIAIAGALWLNPFCAVLFIASATLEGVYCKLLRVTHLKIIPSIIVKATGGFAGVFAVDPDPSPAFLAVLFLWLATWEVGGQNVANDIVDLEDDSRVGAKTTATVLGKFNAVFLIVSSLSMAALASVAIYWTAGPGIGPIYPFAAAAVSWFLLLDPAYRVYADPGRNTAASLFNKASYMPTAFLILAVASMAVPV